MRRSASHLRVTLSHRAPLARSPVTSAHLSRSPHRLSILESSHPAIQPRNAATATSHPRRPHPPSVRPLSRPSSNFFRAAGTLPAPSRRHTPALAATPDLAAATRPVSAPRVSCRRATRPVSPPHPASPPHPCSDTAPTNATTRSLAPPLPRLSCGPQAILLPALDLSSASLLCSSPGALAALTWRADLDEPRSAGREGSSR